MNTRCHHKKTAALLVSIDLMAPPLSEPMTGVFIHDYPIERQGCQVPVTLVNQDTHSLLAPAFQKGIVAIMAT